MSGDKRGEFFVHDEMCSNSNSPSVSGVAAAAAAGNNGSGGSRLANPEDEIEIVKSSSPKKSNKKKKEEEKATTPSTSEKKKRKSTPKNTPKNTPKKKMKKSTEMNEEVQEVQEVQEVVTIKKEDTNNKDIENEMEAMFADTEEDEKPSKSPKKKKAVKRELKTEEDKNGADSSPPVKKKRKYVKKKDKKEVKEEPATPDGPKKRGRKKKDPKSSALLSKKKRGEKISDQDLLLEKYKGPFVRVLGDDINNSKWFNVINSSFDSLGPSTEATKSTVSSISEEELRSKLTNYTLRNDPTNPNEPWLCVFCKQGTHYQGLGDLFGPYFMSKEMVKIIQAASPKKKPESGGATNSAVAGESSSTTPGGKGTPKKKKKSLDKSENVLPDQKSEVWFHEDCLCWMQNIEIVGQDLLGLEDAIKDSLGFKCVKCQLSGPTLCCTANYCKQVIHYPCARNANWKLNEEDFKAYCINHRE